MNTPRGATSRGLTVTAEPGQSAARQVNQWHRVDAATGPLGGWEPTGWGAPSAAEARRCAQQLAGQHPGLRHRVVEEIQTERTHCELVAQPGQGEGDGGPGAAAHPDGETTDRTPRGPDDPQPP